MYFLVLTAVPFAAHMYIFFNQRERESRTSKEQTQAVTTTLMFPKGCDVCFDSEIHAGKTVHLTNTHV